MLAQTDFTLHATFFVISLFLSLPYNVTMSNGVTTSVYWIRIYRLLPFALMFRQYHLSQSLIYFLCSFERTTFGNLFRVYSRKSETASLTFSAVLSEPSRSFVKAFLVSC